MLYWAILLLATLVNSIGIKAFPTIEVLTLTFHVCFFFALMIPLLVLAPKSTASYVFTSFENNSGWKSDGVAWCVGMLSEAYCLTGYDGATHLCMCCHVARYCRKTLSLRRRLTLYIVCSRRNASTRCPCSSSNDLFDCS